ncbi:MAG TPA: TolC family protein [Desulfuromonadales bacterium]|nr:TolC family protein [Desulfuromonadales bacterium]HIJ87563.1 TolC family protein [Desulfuromonadales bacterium]
MRVMCLLLILSLSAGCTTITANKSSAEQMPEHWQTESGQRLPQVKDVDLSTWWGQFGDERLNTHIKMVIEANHDLKLAKSRVIESRELRNARQGFLAPQIDATASYSRVRQSQNASTFPPLAGSRSNYTMINSGLEASWELDLYGGVRAGVDVADAELKVSELDGYAIRIAVIAEAVRNYVELRVLQQQLLAAEENSSSSQSIEDIVTIKESNGLVPLLDVYRAEAERSSADAEVARLEGEVERVKNRLAVLAGQRPGALSAVLGSGMVPHVPDTVGLYAPAELLSRRPDILKAEQEVIAASGRVKISRTDLYPRVSLLGSIGTQSISLSNLFAAGSNYWAAGPSIRFPLFNFGRLKSLVKAEEARQQQAVVGFEKSVLTALEDVESSIVLYIRSEERRRHLASAVEAALQARKQAEDLYQSGIGDYLPVLDTRRTHADLRVQLHQAEGNAAKALIGLNTSLGGGWDVVQHVVSNQ